MRIMLILSLFASGCTTLRVNSDYDPSVDFTRYTSYAWWPSDERPGDGAPSELTDRRIRNAVESILAERNIPRVSPDDASFLVRYSAASETALSVRSHPRSHPRGGSDVSVRQYEKGTLIIDFLDAGSRELTWRGIATGVIRESWTPEQREQKIREAVRAVLQQFPPSRVP